MKHEQSKRPIGWMISTLVLGILLVLSIITIVGGVLSLKSYTQERQAEVQSASNQTKAKQSDLNELQGKYDKLESDYRNAQTALSTKSTQSTAPSASKCTSQYLYSSNKYVTSCN